MRYNGPITVEVIMRIPGATARPTAGSVFIGYWSRANKGYYVLAGFENLTKAMQGKIYAEEVLRIRSVVILWSRSTKR